MSPEDLKRMLEEVAAGGTSVDDALKRLRLSPFAELGDAVVDVHRSLRCGFPEVIFCPGKSAGQVLRIARELHRGGGPVLATRAQAEVVEALRNEFPGEPFEVDERARAVLVGRPAEVEVLGTVLVVSGGTGDIPVAEEAAFTARALGSPVKTAFDVGVAGIHRLLSCADDLARASVVVAVAGMEGALASVVGGLVSCPVVAVPTSIGYGASFKGLAALLAMLNSCAANVSVVNIDDGFGGGYVAGLMNRVRGEGKWSARRARPSGPYERAASYSSSTPGRSMTE